MLKFYSYKISKIFKDLKNANIIEINGKKYKELINVMYEIKYKKIDKRNYILSNIEDDKNEREYLLMRVDDCINELKKCINSRRAVYCNLYNNELCKCICLVHLFIRKNKLYINEYYRSQEFKKNRMYDFQTAMMLMEKAINFLNVKPGKITVFVANLHIEI